MIGTDLATDLRVLGVPTDRYNGGGWRASEDGARFNVDDPATGEPIARVANATVADGLAEVLSSAFSA